MCDECPLVYGNGNSCIFITLYLYTPLAYLLRYFLVVLDFGFLGLSTYLAWCLQLLLLCYLFIYIYLVLCFAVHYVVRIINFPPIATLVLPSRANIQHPTANIQRHPLVEVRKGCMVTTL